jgi:hypothetical protein
MKKTPTWRELEAQGVKRCCAMFKDGKRCRRRVLAGVYDSWCGKHGAIMEAHIKHANSAIRAQLKSDEDDE